MLAGLGCCVAMSMPQVHIVAYASDLGYGVTHGARMLSVMLGIGVVSRLASGWIADRHRRRAHAAPGLGAPVPDAGALPAGSTASSRCTWSPRCSACPRAASCRATPSSCGNTSRPQEAGTRIGTVVMATIVGMALGGWMSGAIFDLTGSYHAAFVNGIIWNLLNLGVALWLLGQRAADAGDRLGASGRGNRPRKPRGRRSAP